MTLQLVERFLNFEIEEDDLGHKLKLLEHATELLKGG